LEILKSLVTYHFELTFQEQEILHKKMAIEGLAVDQKCIELIKDLAIKAFLVLEKAWHSLNVVLVDYKVEFGVTSDSKEIILADVIDNDSWRIWPKGNHSF
jgi:phosphoribosylaminoimidazole carboxylase/phosphoribosylaminoimidazole-succinocarboxamide synthase